MEVEPRNPACTTVIIIIPYDVTFVFFRQIYVPPQHALRRLGGVVVRASDSRPVQPGALPGSLGQLSLPSLRGR